MARPAFPQQHVRVLVRQVQNIALMVDTRFLFSRIVLLQTFATRQGRAFAAGIRARTSVVLFDGGQDRQSRRGCRRIYVCATTQEALERIRDLAADLTPRTQSN
jgi:hypothetical protein